jgi:hypothetical protein
MFYNTVLCFIHIESPIYFFGIGRVLWSSVGEYRWEGQKVVGLSLKSRRRRTRENFKLKDCIYHILSTSIAFDQSSTNKKIDVG